MCNYRCPYAERKPCAGFLLCRDLYKEGVNYNIRENAMTVICAFQKQCMRTGMMENTDTAKGCFEMRSARHNEAVPAEVTPEPKTARKKKG